MRVAKPDGWNDVPSAPAVAAEAGEAVVMLFAVTTAVVLTKVGEKPVVKKVVYSVVVVGTQLPMRQIVIPPRPRPKPGVFVM
jgi:hypothetical protein